MWARNLGVPHLWPSRVKVFFLGLLTSVFILSVFQYLHSANVGYLDLQRPGQMEISCKLPVPECRGNESDPIRCTVLLEGWTFWRGLNLSNAPPCPALPTILEDQTCSNPAIPLDFITGDSSKLHTVNSGVNPFQLWGLLFLILTSLLALSILIHDLALLEERLRPKILSIPQMRYATPCFWECMECFQCRAWLRRLWNRRPGLWLLVFPFYLLFQMVSFMALIYPIALVVFLITPVRMSRIMVFLSGILCMLWSIVFVLEITAFDTNMYALLWAARPDEGSSDQCVCLCEFPLSRSVKLRIAALGGGVCWQAFNLTFRALKGLRRGQWANMFSVLHSVPVEAFPVIWDTGEGPLRWRKEGQPVQSEPAFDPFCLMDEQPDSAWTRVTFRPTGQTAHQQLMWEPFTGTLDTEIGFCGFPRRFVADTESEILGTWSANTSRRGSRQYRKESLDEDFADFDLGLASSSLTLRAGAYSNGHHVLGKPLSEHDEPAVPELPTRRQSEPSMLRHAEVAAAAAASKAADSPDMPVATPRWHWVRSFAAPAAGQAAASAPEGDPAMIGAMEPSGDAPNGERV